MLSFVLAGLYTLAVLAAGFAAGYWIGSKKQSELEDIVRELRRTQRKPSPESGPVRPYTPEEREQVQSKEHQTKISVMRSLGVEDRKQ